MKAYKHKLEVKICEVIAEKLDVKTDAMDHMLQFRQKYVVKTKYKLKLKHSIQPLPGRVALPHFRPLPSKHFKKIAKPNVDSIVIKSNKRYFI